MPMTMIDHALPDTPSQSRVNLISVCLGLTGAFVVQTMLLITIPLTALELGASSAMVGVILSAPYLLPLVLAIPLGGLITSWGAKRSIVAGGLGLVLGVLSILALPGFVGLVLAQLVVGVAHMVMILAGQSVVSGLGQGKVLERYFGWYTTCLSAGQLIGPLLAGWLLDTRGSMLTFLVTGAVALLTLVSGCGLTGSARLGHPARREAVGYRAQLRLMRKNPGVQVSIALTVAVVFALSAHGTFLPVYLENLDVSATTIGALVSLRALSAMVVRPFMSTVIDWLGGRVRAMVISALLVAVGLMLTGLVEGVVLLGLLAVLVGVGSGVSQPLSMVVLAESVHPDQRSGAWGVRLMGNRAVQFLAPLSLGLLAEILPYSMTFLIGGWVVLLLVGVMLSRLSAFSGLDSGE
ncbi:MFS transporter [Marinobacter sp.]|uniref:MFS transporter n=1 Tax=Marinobacter sp. TaxID=50741 RepID=UPI003562E3B3